MKKVLAGAVLLLLCFTSCAPQRVAIYCEPQSAGIYIDGEFQGRGIVNYTIPREQKYITISCSEDGVTFVDRRLYTRSLPSVINIYLDEYKSYSSSPQSFSTH